jgi:hypothetical protein
MEIIFEGVIPEEKVRRARCTNCNTIFDFKQSEGKIQHDPREGDYLSINCPLCKKQINLTVKP